MQHESGMVGANGLNGKDDCPFCTRKSIPCILKETPHFLLATDHAPVVEGHLLIIPKEHYACYGEVPAALDEALYEQKREVQHFFARYYRPAIFFEHGIFRQTVYHAHLHCFPFGSVAYDLGRGLHEQVVSSQDDIRAWYATRGHYFYLEDDQRALLFVPDMDRYLSVFREVLWQEVAARTNQSQWLSAKERYNAGGPLIAATVEKWQAFQLMQHEGVRE
jgi:diadenosine tetraphosphate (Ap4A) HIT family hydrolase